MNTLINNTYKYLINCKGKVCKNWKENGKINVDFTYNGHFASQQESIGVVIPKDYIVLDFDDKRQGKVIINILNDLKIKFNYTETDKGFHIWLKNNGLEKQLNLNYLPIGCFQGDTRIGELGYVIWKLDGNMRNMDGFKYELGELDICPDWLIPKKNSTLPILFGMKSGDGRNEILMKQVKPQLYKWFSLDVAHKTLDIINNYIFYEPLTNDEMDNIKKDQQDYLASKTNYDKTLGKKITAKEKYLLNLANVAREWVRKYKIIRLIDTSGNSCVQYKDLETNKYYDDFKKFKLNLAQDYSVEELLYNIQDWKQLDELITMTAKKINTKGDTENIIYTKNQKITLEQDNIKVEKRNVDDFVINDYPYDYDKDAEAVEPIDRALKNISCGDNDLKEYILKMIGYSLFKTTKFEKAFFLYGEGNNGKSLLMNIILALHDEKNSRNQNTFSADLHQLAVDKFNDYLMNKTLVFNEDIDNKYLENTGRIKSLISGADVAIERKGKSKFMAYINSTFIFAGNSFIKSNDKTDGWKRRWEIIPFDYDAKKDPHKDPNIKRDTLTNKSLSYLMKLAIEAYSKQHFKNEWKSHPKIELLNKLMNNVNDNVYHFFTFDKKTADWFIGKTTNDVYNYYKEFCREEGIIQLGESDLSVNKKLITQANLTLRIKEYFRIDTLRKNGNNGGTVFIEKK